MCGRYALHANPDVIALQFGLDSVPEFKPSFNIAPAASTLVVRKTAEGIHTDPAELREYVHDTIAILLRK